MVRNTALYIGAGLDTIPLQYGHWIDKFICIDSQPYSEFGILQGGLGENGYDKYYRPNFIKELNKSYRQNGFVLISCGNGNKRIYSQNKRQIDYYINTSIPDHHKQNTPLFQDIHCVIVSGHDPDSVFLKYTTQRLEFVGIEGTCFNAPQKDPFYENSLLSRLHRGEVQYFFHKYTFLHKNGEKKEFRFWEDFLDYYDDLCCHHVIEF